MQRWFINLFQLFYSAKYSGLLKTLLVNTCIQPRINKHENVFYNYLILLLAAASHTVKNKVVPTSKPIWICLIVQLLYLLVLLLTLILIACPQAKEQLYSSASWVDNICLFTLSQADYLKPPFLTVQTIFTFFFFFLLLIRQYISHIFAYGIVGKQKSDIRKVTSSLVVEVANQIEVKTEASLNGTFICQGNWWRFESEAKA